MIQLGIIGAGRIGKVHAQSLCKNINNVTVKAITDPLMTNELADWALGLGVKKIAADYHEIISDPEISAVLVCSSTDTHAAVSIEAAKAKKHVFCEKPVDTQPERIREVIAAVRDNGVQFQVGFNRRFDANFAAIREAVANGQVGDVHLVNITSRDPEPPSPAYVKVSGGIFMDMTIHDFDMARFLTGSEADEVYAAGAVLVDPAIGEAGDIDTAVITIRMTNGSIVTIGNSRKAAYGYDQRAEVFGSKGCVSCANKTNSSIELSTGDGVWREKPLYFFLERYMQSFGDEMKAFIESVENKKPTPVGAQDGLAPVLIAMAAKKSLELKRPVKLTEI